MANEMTMRYEISPRDQGDNPGSGATFTLESPAQPTLGHA